jgi:hypothetical protein
MERYAMRRTGKVFSGLCAVVIGLPLLACEKEQRLFRATPSEVERAGTVRMSELQPRAGKPSPAVKSPYVESADAIAEEERLY